MIYFDKFSEIGSSHKENEDYVVVGDEENPFIIVADGCSSSENSAIGSRIISLCMAKIIRTQDVFTDDMVYLGGLAINNALNIAENIGIGKESLDSTLMVAMVAHNYIKIRIWGDGYVFAGRKDGKVEVIKVEYTPEIPYYLSYSIDKDRRLQYESMARNGGIRKTEQGTDFTNEYSAMSSHWIKFDAEITDYIILATDGVSSFQKDNIDINQEEINEQITSFKRLNGEFIGRRMKRMIKMNDKDGIKHYDDLTIAGMSFVEDGKN